MVMSTEMPYIRTLDDTTELNRMVKRLYGSPSIGGFIEVGPFNNLMISEYESVYEEIKQFPIHDDDIFVVGYPKSGTRWTEEMVWLICNDFNYGKAKEVDLINRFPTLETDGVSFYNINVGKILSEMERPRLIKTHLHWSLFPNEITSNAKKPKFIVVLRSVEDVCLSQFHHHRTTLGFKGSFEEFCKLFLAGKVLQGPYWSQVLSVWDQREHHSMLFIRYEDMKKDLAAIIRQVANFLGKTVPEEEMPKLMDHLSFDSLKKNPAFNHEDMLAQFNGDCNPFTREGIFGGHKAVMTPEMIGNFKDMNEKMFRGTGFSYIK
ncbi:sulfotransferase family cytosolic 1B member 1-like [Photinus pyralis]|uniref:sulfotransferase family cytosolic 1B member 1-like n=1 Tax=Photinus pyralis TaxID=7054 RepID=UPI0012670ACF|nr:sulfotransferase family cytosolic 1B member 1-like [Photinus pyralis]